MDTGIQFLHIVQFEVPVCIDGELPGSNGPRHWGEAAASYHLNIGVSRTVCTRQSAVPYIANLSPLNNPDQRQLDLSFADPRYDSGDNNPVTDGPTLRAETAQVFSSLLSQ